MDFEFQVTIRTQCIETHTVRLRAPSMEEATAIVIAGGGEYVSFDRDEMTDSKVFGVSPAAASS